MATTACPKLTALSHYAPTVPKTAYQPITLGKQRFVLAGVNATAVKLVISRSWAAGSKAKAGIKAYTYRYFVSSDVKLAVTVLVELYAVRWEIETFHAHLKQLLGLDHNQCWLSRSIEQMWAIVLMASSYLMLEAIEHTGHYAELNQLRVSLGQVVAQLRYTKCMGILAFSAHATLVAQPDYSSLFLPSLRPCKRILKLIEYNMVRIIK